MFFAFWTVNFLKVNQYIEGLMHLLVFVIHLFFVYFCVLKYKITFTVAYHAPFFHKIKFLYCVNVHISYCVRSSILSQFLIQYTSVQICFLHVWGYTELAPSVAIFCTNMAVESISRML
jgi:hypothetical protein